MIQLWQFWNCRYVWLKTVRMHEHITGSEYEYMIWNWYLSIELFTIILNIFIYKITFWALSMILSNKRVLEKLQKQVDDTLENTPGNLIKSSVWCSTWVRYSTRRNITFWICKHQKYLEIIDIIKHLFKLFFWRGGATCSFYTGSSKAKSACIQFLHSVF